MDGTDIFSTSNLAKAVLYEITLGEDSTNQSPRRTVPVQFNPETLKVSYTNQLANGGQTGGSALQFSGRGETKLSLDLLFDIDDPNIDPRYKDKKDVREITKEIIDFLKATESGSGEDTRYTPPGVRFSWGRFLFEGVVVSVNENVEFFDEDGAALRASVSLNMTKQEVDASLGDQRARRSGLPNPLGEASPGTTPMDFTRANEAIQQAAARVGRPEDWQDIALANRIENPRQIPAGTPLDLDIRTGRRITWP